ncbi:hypothetical protein [Azospirillum sp. sgz302134]
MNHRLAAAGLVALLAVGAQLAPGTARAQTAPPPPVLSPNIPDDSKKTGGFNLHDLQHDFDTLGWQTFVGLNWPANPDGSPDTSRTIGAVDAPTVWEAWPEFTDVFLPDGSAPTWHAPRTLPKACQGLAATGTKLLTQTSKTPNLLNASIQPFKTGPIIDQQGRYARFQISVNRVMFDYVVNNTLYNQQGQKAFAAAGNKVNFPCATPQTPGAIMVKAAWKVLEKGVDDPGQFHSTRALVYTPPSDNPKVEESCTVADVGLAGFHIGYKIHTTPQWIWATFEHVNNVPTKGQPIDRAKYNFYNPNCTDCAVNTPPPRPWNPSTGGPPSQIVREIPIEDVTQGVTTDWHGALAAVNPKSVWLNYILVGTQWPTGQVANCELPQTGDPLQAPTPMFLANSTLESYTQGTVPNVSSTCMECHANATDTTGAFSDFTYTLSFAQPAASAAPAAGAASK